MTGRGWERRVSVRDDGDRQRDRQVFRGVSSAAIFKTVQRVEARREADPSWESQLAELTAELANPRLSARLRRFERDLPFLIPYRTEPDRQFLLCLLLEHQS